MNRATLLAAGVIVLVVRGTAGAAPLERLEYKDDRLTLRADETPMEDVIDSLKRASGAELRGNAPDQNVTAILDDVPLREALERLLGSQSFTLTYGDKGRLKTIELKGGPVAAKHERRGAPGMSQRVHDDKENPRWMAVLDSLFRPVPVNGRLREIAGSDETGWDLILQKASQHDDPDLRTDAIRAGVRAIERDPAMHEAMMGALRAMDDEQLTQFVSAMARSVDDDPETFLKSIVRFSHDVEVRSRAKVVMRELRAAQRANAGPA
jgi:hypothetical protein